LTKFFAEALYENGFTELVSVIPPSGQLAPSSKIPQSAVGKSPGRKNANGTWGGYDWLRHVPTPAEIKQWSLDGANVGILAGKTPGVDIDCTDETLARIIEQAAIAKLGRAPIRVGKAPKRLLMYRLEGEPFSRMRLLIHRGEEVHLVEVLGHGQQYLIHGIHPVTQRPYEWNMDLTVMRHEQLTPISREQASEFLDYLEASLPMIGITKVERAGDGRNTTRAPGIQDALVAPSIDILRSAVRVIPNTNDLFPERGDYIKVGHAIRAACGDEIEEGQAIFMEWAEKWEGNARGKNDPGIVLSDWRRFRAPFAVGWPWLSEQARKFGFDVASLEFDVTEEKPTDKAPEIPLYSDQDLAERVVARLRDRVRFVPQEQKFMVWNDGRWRRDAELLAEDLVKRELRQIASVVAVQGATPKERREAEGKATSIVSAGKLSAVMALVKSDRAIAVSVDTLDHDDWILNTPGGMVDLKSGKLLPADPDALCTKSTAVPPDFNADCPRWHRFLDEATGGNADVKAYLQRLAGYALTGSTREQHLTFIHGPGGSGKSTFLNTIAQLMRDYWQNASMDTFTASYGEKHSTDIAMLAGARLVTASETQAGRRWDETKVKSLTGGDPVTARFMRSDNFVFIPQFKLIFIGNHKPQIRDVEEGMRRRIQIVEFNVKPEVVDKELNAKLREEWPAILAWMVEGCLEWQQVGLNPPAVVKAASEEYFSDEDAVGRWLTERTEVDTSATVTTQALFESWREWANANGEYVGSQKRLASALIARKTERWQDGKTRRMGFRGIRLIDRQEFEIMT
jgi:P4 family phage/plasmid primase-like protien